jgi:hypothetical protein
MRRALLAALLLALSSAVHGGAAEPRLEEILTGLRRAEAARESSVREMVYIAEARVVEWEDPSRTEIRRETESLRRVYVREPDLMHNEYLSMSIDGRPLSRREMERELAKQRRGGRRDGGGSFLSPFSPEADGLYDFRLLGKVDYEGQPAWRIGFAPREPDETRFRGTALVSRGDFQPMYVEMAPSELPGVLEEFAMSVRFEPVGGFRLPARFLMQMRVKVSVLVTLADRTLTIEDRYSDYRLNPGLDDALFDEPAGAGGSPPASGRRRER